MATTDEIIKKIHNIILDDLRLKVYEVAVQASLENECYIFYMKN